MRRVLWAVVLVLATQSATLLGAAPAPATPGPPAAPEYWFASWHVPRLWASGARGQGVTIAEVDSGVNASLPELRGKILAGRDFGPHGGDGRTDHDLELFGHGTAMASIMVARTGTLGITGLAPDARILPIAVPLNGTTEQSRAGKVPAAIGYAVDHGADVINLSIGGMRYGGSGNGDPCPPAEQHAVFRALSHGVIVVAAVGNTGPRKNTVEEPGACLGVIAVGAVSETGRVARFSARQPYLALAAPGVNVPSLGRVAGQAFSGDGTSQAAALVSASAALVWSRHPRLSGQQVTARLLATLADRRRVPDPRVGYGLLDAYAAVTAGVPPNAPDPIAARARPFLQRRENLAHGLGRPPPPAAHGRVPAGHGHRALAAAPPSPPADHRGLGIALAVAGALALVLLLVAAALARRSRADSRPSPSSGGLERE